MSHVIRIVPTDDLIDRLYQLYSSLDDLGSAEEFDHYVGVAIATCRTNPPSRLPEERICERLGDSDSTHIFMAGLEEFAIQMHRRFKQYDMYGDLGFGRLSYRFERLEVGDIVMSLIERPRTPVSILELMENDDCHPRI